MDRFKIFKSDEDAGVLKEMSSGPVNWIFDSNKIRIYFEEQYTIYKAAQDTGSQPAEGTLE